jgi:prolyl oligopeptidase
MTARRIALFLLCFITLIPASYAAEKQGGRDLTRQPFPVTGNPVVETWCGNRIADPYRALENIRNPQVINWLKQESDYARNILQRIPGRDSLISKMQDFDKRKVSKVYNLAITENDFYFYLKQTPSDETGLLYYRKGFHGKEALLFDPSSSHDKESHAVIGTISPSLDGSKVAFTISKNGSEDAVLLIMDVATQKLFPEKITRCRFASPSWLNTGNVFLYNRLRALKKPDENPQYNSKIFLHIPGTDPSSDREIFSSTTNPELVLNPEDIPEVTYEKNSGHLFAFLSNVDRRLTVYYAPLDQPEIKKTAWKKLFMPEDDVHDFAVTEKDIYFSSPKKAPGFRLLKTSLEHPDLEHADLIVPETPGTTLTGFTLTSKGIFYTQSKNGVEEKLYHREYGKTESKEINLPAAAGTIAISSKGFRHPDLWVIIAGWSQDYRRYRYDTRNDGSFSLETLSSPALYPEYEKLKVEELMIPSHDGVMFPLSIICRNDLEKKRNNPVLLYGYGAYGNSLTPFFSPSLLLWTHKGGILAIVHARGGGELGDAWHTSGMKTMKPNTWKDLISSAEYLIREGYTSTRNIAINGASAGGIMVGRAMTERPDLFAAAIPQVGLLNPLRGEETPNGPVNVPEFGTVKKPDECKALIAMDAYLNITDGTRYPATLVTAGINDPRVIAWQPAKFAARLQAATVSNKPVLLFTDFKAGHGMGNTKKMEFESLADVLSFGLWQTGHPEFQMK